MLLYNGIVLDYSIKHKITNKLLSKLTKTQMIYPVDIKAMIHRPNALTALCELHKSCNGPLLSTNCKVCLKYHVKGFCLGDCNFRGSHTKLSGGDFSRINKYIKSLRS